MDGLGNPVHLQLSAGNLNDSTVAVNVLSHVMIKDSVVQVDRAYGTTEIRAYISEQQATYSIPPKTNTREPWPCDWWLYKERHLVECFFQKLKQFRRIATRYDKLASRFLAFVLLASICILVK